MNVDARARAWVTLQLSGLAPLRGLTVVRIDGGGHALHDSLVPELVEALLTEPAALTEAAA